jgi:hypothetical protein
VNLFKEYGLVLFLAPFALGLISALISGYRKPRSWLECQGIAFFSVTLVALFCLIFAMEGFICIFMAAPIAYALAALGALLGYYMQKRPLKAGTGLTILFIMISIPLLMGAEYLNPPMAQICPITTKVIINAPIEMIWKNVIAFPPLSEPKELLFQKGVAYPTYAVIRGKGVGAVRECHFSTGAFIEPITVWDENHQLQFDVTAQPPAMKEWSLYDIHPPHLDNYLVSKKGRFLLTKLPDGRVELEGTTWYSNRMWPQTYWRVWSDYLIHKIHSRVLEHIKTISQSETNGFSAQASR